MGDEYRDKGPDRGGKIARAIQPADQPVILFRKGVHDIEKIAVGAALERSSTSQTARVQLFVFARQEEEFLATEGVRQETGYVLYHLDLGIDP